MSSDELDLYNAMVVDALAAGRADVNGLIAANQNLVGIGYQGFRNDVTAVLTRKADAVTLAASERERLYLMAIVAVVVGVLAATWVTAQSMTRPLRSLKRQAMDVAHRRLPSALDGILSTPLGENVTVPELEPISVATRDEVARRRGPQRRPADGGRPRGRAGGPAVQHRGLVRQLGRRNQNLLVRQLDLITNLEREQVDPDALAGLFRLDHLATRMRRNAESLLVLAGVEPARTWSDPIPVTDVVRAALGEVHGYGRVSLGHIERVTVVGAAASDLAPLFAELIENALAFSPVTQPVEMFGQARPDGYVVAIVDAGLGMRPAEVERAKLRLAGAESFTVAPSKYLGHYVSGHLARRHGVVISLRSETGSGVFVTVTLPVLLLAERPPMDSGRATWIAQQHAAGAPPARAS